MVHARMERQCSCGEPLYFHRNRPTPDDPLGFDHNVEIFHGHGEARLHITHDEELALPAVNPLGVGALLALIDRWLATVHRYEEG